MWFNGDRELQKGCLFNFFETIRGTGKTYWAKCLAARRWLSGGGNFIYLRRYATEVKEQKNFWGQVLHEFEGHALEQKNRNLLIDGKQAGILFPLSKALTVKSVDFSGTGLIIFDEVQIPKGSYHYLPKEVEAFLDFYESVNRVRERSEEVTAVFLSNRISDYNPYYDYFSIRFADGKDTYRRGEIFAKRPTLDEFAEVKGRTRFGSIIKDTPYGAYNFGGHEQMEDDGAQVKPRPSGSKYWFTVTVNGKPYGLWGCQADGTLYFSDRYDPSMPMSFCLTKPDIKTGGWLIMPGDRRAKMLSRAYQVGAVFYESVKVKMEVKPAVQRLATR